MRRDGLLHPELAAVVAGLGHGQVLLVADAGLPVPNGPRRIDLAVRCGVPSFRDVFAAIAAELPVERAIVASEADARGPALRSVIEAAFAGDPPPVDAVTHERLKELSADAVAVVRTGECTPYMNVLLVAGVAFS